MITERNNGKGAIKAIPLPSSNQQSAVNQPLAKPGPARGAQSTGIINTTIEKPIFHLSCFIFENKSLSLKDKLIAIYEKNHRMRTQLQRGTR